MDTPIQEILAEDERRRSARADAPVHDPLRGAPSAARTPEPVATPDPAAPEAYLPLTMAADPEYGAALRDPGAWQRLRCRHDFEYWCARCVVIRHKTRAANVPFVLNRPQRILLEALERDRLAERPIRVILLKARQWGGSTLTQVYMAWIQSCHRRNWNSLICAHVKDASATIRGVYSMLLDNYPSELWEGDEAPQFKPFERAQNVREITGRGCRVTISSIENQDAVRGADYAMAHLSETAFWKKTRYRSPADYVRAVCGAIAMVPLSLIVMESTANGVGNYFHSEWLRAKEGRSDKQAVFIPWYEIEMYRLPPRDRKALAASLTEYERSLWHLGLDLDQINWYRSKCLELGDMQKVHAEYPTNDVEAFSATGNRVFAGEGVERLRCGCREPATRGELALAGRKAVFTAESGGRLAVWQMPEPGGRYVVAVDVGGRSASADWSVIAVLRKPATGRPAEIVAQWRGHCDHDILAAQAEAVARFYNNGFLIIESNTFETDCYGGADEANGYVLNCLSRRYTKMYHRMAFDTATQTSSRRVGFHTNRSTKSVIIQGLVRWVREGAYIERDNQACNELMCYEQRPNGSYGATEGYHDDILITRALALYVLDQRIPC